MIVRSFPLLIFALLAPLSAHASLVISEIMYDLDGADSGREWVEITNDGGSPIDLTGYKFFEANTNHGLTVGQGSFILPLGGSLIIADDPAKFLIDWPGYTGSILDSSFSLSNTGETIALRRADLVDEDIASYDSTMGAAGDGNALVRTGATFTPSLPTPGSHSVTTSPSASPPSVPPLPSSSLPATSPSSPTALAGEPTTITVLVGGQKTPTVGADSLFEATAYGVNGKRLEGVRYLWSFGNGDTKEGNVVSYAYPYPGKYLILVAASGFDGSATGRFIVEAHPARLTLRAETDGSIALLNREGREVDVSGWVIRRGGTSFIIPRTTIVLPNEGVRFALQTTKLLELTQVPELLYPNGTRADPREEPPHPLPPAHISATETALLLESFPRKSANSSAAQAPELQTALSEKVEVQSEENTASVISSARAAGQSGNNLWLLLSLFGVIVAGVCAVLLVRHSWLHDIEIIEEKD